MQRTSVVIVAALWFSIIGPIWAQEVLRVERERVFAIDGKVVKLREPLTIPIGKGPGKVAEFDFLQPGVSAFQIHFQLASAPADSTFTIKVFDNHDLLAWKYTRVRDTEDEWSKEVYGSNAKVVIESTRVNQPFEVYIDKSAVAESRAVPRSITPPDQREGIESQVDYIKELGRATARLRFIADDGNRYVCTGFLISVDLFVTNQHCPSTEAEWRSSLVDFDYDAPLASPKTLRFSQQVAVDHDLDFAIYRLESKLTDRRPLKLVKDLPAEGEALLIVEHPGGQSKQISLTDCRVRGTDLEGVSPRNTDFGHMCDTLGGSSGSSVLALKSKRVVGLHHLGFLGSGDEVVNRSVKMKLIIELIAKRYPALKAELGL